jgi:uncharacterized integral membrane protein
VHEEPEQTTAAPPAEEEQSGEPKEGFGRQWQPRLYLRIIILGLLIAYGIAFVLENNKHVHLHFVVGTTQTSLIWLILLSVALGLVLGVLLSQLYRRSRRRH